MILSLDNAPPSQRGTTDEYISTQRKKSSKKTNKSFMSSDKNDAAPVAPVESKKEDENTQQHGKFPPRE